MVGTKGGRQERGVAGFASFILKLKIFATFTCTSMEIYKQVKQLSGLLNWIIRYLHFDRIVRVCS